MEEIHIDKDIKVFYVTATSFPEGVLEAHQKLRKILPSEDGRSFYGISHPDKSGNIIYKAATTATYEGEGQQYGCETCVIKKGRFISELLHDWCEGENKVKPAFDALLADPRIDKNGYCLEEYIDDRTMRCMVPLDETLVLHHYKENLLQEIETTYNQLYSSLSAFDNEQFNTIPFEGSWTAGQVTEHIIKSIGDIPDQQTKAPDRPYDEMVASIRKMFLDFTTKMQSPEFILPEEISHDKAALLHTLKEIQAKHIQLVKSKDLTMLCLGFEFPTVGCLTRFEWINFYLVHTQRHTHQLNKIYQKIINN